MRTEAKLTLLRHYAEGEDIEAADVAIERMATEDELKAVWRDPARWSFVCPRSYGAIAGDGAYDTLQECLDHALDSCALVTWGEVISEGQGHPRPRLALLLWPPDEGPAAIPNHKEEEDNEDR